VDVEQPVGAALDRDISRAEVVETDLERFISARHAKRVAEEGRDQAEEQAWIESTRRHNALREAELREQWSSFHLDQAARHRATLEALASHHEQRADELMGSGGDAA
jgi:hypothetical protein